MNSSPPLLPLGVITYTSPEFASSGIVRLMRVSPHSPYSEEVGEMPEMRTSAVLRSWPKYRPVTISTSPGFATGGRDRLDLRRPARQAAS